MAVCATLDPMRTVVAILVAAVSGFALAERVVAAPPEDIAAQCRASFPQASLQVRCSYLESAAAQRVASVATGVAGDLFNRCLVISQSWTAMESCLAQVASVPGNAPGSPPASTASPGAPGNVGTVQPPSGTPAAPAEAASPTPDAADAASPRTTTPGAQAGPAAAVIEPERPTRPISEADAERQLRAVLERVGYPRARCTKKQYGPGWASICE
jgi:hypothetical protein